MQQKLTRLFAGFLAVLALAFASQPASARHILHVTGSVSDAQVEAECPPGQALQGFSGGVGSWIDRIQLVCAVPLADGRFAQPAEYGSEYGGTGGLPQMVHCGRDFQMVSGLLKITKNAAQIAAITLNCRSRITGETRDEKVFGNPNYSGTCGDRDVFVGDCDYEFSQRRHLKQNCASDEVPIGAKIYYGSAVTAIGLICGRITNASAPVASGPPPPPRANPNRPGRTGTGIVTPPPAPQANPARPGRTGTGVSTTSERVDSARWLGVFRLKTSQGSEFNLVMHDNEGGVWGEFTHANSQYNGTLVGTLVENGQRLNYTYEQPALNAYGSGTLKILGGGTLFGSGKTTDDPPVNYSWSATRTSPP